MVLVAKREAGHAADQAAQEHARHRGGREGGGGPRPLLLSRFDAGVGVEGETGVRPRGERICIGPALRLPPVCPAASWAVDSAGMNDAVGLPEAYALVLSGLAANGEKGLNASVPPGRA